VGDTGLATRPDRIIEILAPFWKWSRLISRTFGAQIKEWISPSPMGWAKESRTVGPREVAARTVGSWKAAARTFGAQIKEWISPSPMGWAKESRTVGPEGGCAMRLSFGTRRFPEQPLFSGRQRFLRQRLFSGRGFCQNRRFFRANGP
jgi:hypothetical protein